MHIHFLQKVDLVLDAWHPAATCREGVLRIALCTGRIIDAPTLREDPSQKIITDDPETVCRALGIPFPDPQIVKQ